MSFPRTLGELRQSPFSEQRLFARRVKDELRDNLVCKLREGGPLFPGIVGYEDTVVPQIVNAILSRHNFILLGLRGQAKSRILRALTTLLDPQMPYLAGCEVHDNPFAPICRRCREEIARLGDDSPIAYLSPDGRYVEKLATPDVTIADLIGDMYPIRLPLDVALVFSANPEDYTARGKIITPLKDRIGSEIRTHYPATVEEGITITAQEAWTRRNGHRLHLPKYVQEVIERIAFAAREDKKIDKRSGVSQRLPISAMENVISNAERRAITNAEKLVVPRISDVYAALPAITGKLELEYEGEMKGADFVGRDLIRAAIAKTYDEYFTGANLQPVVQWFDLGGEIQLSDSVPALEALENLKEIQGLADKLSPLGVSQKESPEQQVSAAEFVLEGLHAHKRIGRNEERVFKAGEKKPEPREREKTLEREEGPYRQRRQFN